VISIKYDDDDTVKSEERVHKKQQKVTTTDNAASYRPLRSARTNRLLVPSVKLSTVGGRAFPVTGLTSLNNLPDKVTRISPTAASGVTSRHIGFPATGAQCDILLNCAL